jgi:hypothetical protein
MKEERTNRTTLDIPTRGHRTHYYYDLPCQRATPRANSTGLRREFTSVRYWPVLLVAPNALKKTNQSEAAERNK